MSERPEQYGDEHREECTVLNDLVSIHEQVRQFVERETEYWCKVTSIYSNARTRYVPIPGLPNEATSKFPLFDKRMTFDVDAIEVQNPSSIQMNFQVEAIMSRDAKEASTLVMVMKKRTNG